VREGRNRGAAVGSGGQTETRLLDVAEGLFAARGFACTSVRDITTGAGCNLAAVSYHFGSKLGLYAEVLRRRFSVLREQRLTSIRAARDGTGKDALDLVLRAFAVAFMEPLLAEGGGRVITDLLAREMLDPQLPAEMFWQEIAGPVQDALAGAFLGAEPGLDEVGARLCVLSVIGQLLQAVHHWRRIDAGVAPEGLPSLEDVVDHVVRFSAAGTRACARASGKTVGQGVGRHRGRELG
jgi:TetR/AcrR family transcriptional regulator, regulator of cefoperazone and chloramphenicol sensitivity